MLLRFDWVEESDRDRVRNCSCWNYSRQRDCSEEAAGPAAADWPARKEAFPWAAVAHLDSQDSVDIAIEAGADKQTAKRCQVVDSWVGLEEVASPADRN